MKKLMPFFILFFFIESKAQDSTSNNSGLIVKRGWGQYKMNGKKLSERELKAELYKTPITIPFYKKAKTSKILSYSFFVPMAVIALTTNYNIYHIRRDSTYGTRIAPRIGIIISGGAFIFFLIRSVDFTNKAVLARNSARKSIY